MNRSASTSPSDDSREVTLSIEQTWDGVACGASERCRLTVRRRPDGIEVLIDAPLHGDPPPAAPTGELDGLWEFEVVELFVFGPRGPEEAAGAADPALAYTEIEVGPHGHWLCIELRGLRQRRGTFAPRWVEVARHGARWSGRLSIDRQHLPPEPWSLNAYAVHGVPPAPRRYLAASPPGGPRPDFHRPDAAVRWAELSRPTPENEPEGPPGAC